MYQHVKLEESLWNLKTVLQFVTSRDSVLRPVHPIHFHKVPLALLSAETVSSLTQQRMQGTVIEPAAPSTGNIGMKEEDGCDDAKVSS